jgi:3-phenylpropionate/cinnamic acid dioxygenase small subunit
MTEDFADYLRDKHAIEQVYIRYCEIIDQKDFTRLTEVFTEDCVGDYRSTSGRIEQGLAPLIAHVTRGMGAGSDCGATHHNVCNFRVSVDGDSATSKAHFYAVHHGVNRCAGEHYTCWGEYDDHWVRTPASWRVNRRTYRNFLIDGTVDVVRKARGK